MATLTVVERAAVRKKVARLAESKGVTITWLKGHLDSAVQAIEDRWEATGTKTAIANDIEAAAPGVFTNAQKAYIVRYWLTQKGEREGRLL